MKSVEFDVCEHNFDCWKFVNVWATFSSDISLFDVRALIPIWSVIHYFYMEPKGADGGCKKARTICWDIYDKKGKCV